MQRYCTIFVFQYVTKEMGDEALADLEEDDEIVRTGGIIRLLTA